MMTKKQLKQKLDYIKPTNPISLNLLEYEYIFCKMYAAAELGKTIEECPMVVNDAKRLDFLFSKLIYSEQQKIYENMDIIITSYKIMKEIAHNTLCLP